MTLTEIRLPNFRDFALVDSLDNEARTPERLGMLRLMKPPAPLRSHASSFRLAFLHDDVVGMRRTLWSGRALPVRQKQPTTSDSNTAMSVPEFLIIYVAKKHQHEHRSEAQ
jgi:hypothetical protein